MTLKSSEISQEQFFLTGYNILMTIGEGTFSVVKHATHKITGEQVAIKIVSKSGLHFDDIAQLSTEVRILKLIRHPFIIRLYEYFESPNRFFLVLEIGDCSLSVFVQKFFKNIPMRESSARKFFIQMVSAVSYIHKFLIVHQDLKPENILLCNEYRIAKVADFGLSKILGECQPLNSVGSISYIAPEVLFGEITTSEETGLLFTIILFLFIFNSLFLFFIFILNRKNKYLHLYFF
ncbi:hypothetical protein MXB_1624 [Myxobolus squamalis]|nr:hypothetical protein MXB_1624 [Myxobolus squamalis]